MLILQVYKVETAEQMYEQVNAHFPDLILVIFAAAVADYKPEFVAENKIKKSDKI